MKVELLIADDSELRNAIKDLIKAEVVSIARSEIRDIIAQVTDEKFLPKNPEDIQRIVDRAVQAEVSEVIRRELNNGSYNKASTLKEIAREEVSKAIQKLFEKGIERGQ